MEEKEFSEELKDKLKQINVEITQEQIKKLYIYMNLLIEWNKKINLTTITDWKDIILKHFADSLTINKRMESESRVLDIGTGAGFPGIPLSILNEKTKFTLVDSLNKRLLFLEEVINNLNIKNVELIHARAEEFGKNKKNRESYDIVVSRAVASMNILLEYMLPNTKVGGICICMKGPSVYKEIEDAKNAINVLGGKRSE